MVVHVEPYKSDFHHLCLPIEGKNGLESKLAASFGRSQHFLFINLKGSQVKSHFFLKNPFAKLKVKAGLKAAKLLANQKSETLITPEIGEIAFFTLKQNLFDIFKAKGKTARQNLNSFLKEELKPLPEPTKKQT